MVKKISLALSLLGVVCLASCAAEMEQDQVVAHLFGKDISLAEITPGERELASMRSRKAGLSEEELLFESRSSELNLLISIEVIEAFARGHDVEPTEEEIAGYSEAMARGPNSAEEGAGSGIASTEAETPELAEMQRAFHRGAVRVWKISKALYEAYGGTVIFQQSNPMEPVGAYRKVLEAAQARGDFKILDQRFNDAFWAYFVREDHPFQYPPDQVDYSVPWWLRPAR